MPITPTNTPKNQPTPKNQNKYGIAGWGDAFATWGDLLYTWGTGGITPTNATKYAPTGGILLLEDGFYLLLENGDSILLSSAGIVNQVKN